MQNRITKYDNQEAFILSAKRLKTRITRAKELNIANLTSDELKALVEDLSLAKAVEFEKPVDSFRKGQEYYVQTLLDSVTKPMAELMDAEYSQATMELGSEEDIMKSLEELRVA